MTRRAARPDYDAANAECAALILADPESFGGEGAALVRWARAVMARLAGEQAADTAAMQAPKQEQMQMFFQGDGL